MGMGMGFRSVALHGGVGISHTLGLGLGMGLGLGGWGILDHGHWTGIGTWDGTWELASGFGFTGVMDDTFDTTWVWIFGFGQPNYMYIVAMRGEERRKSPAALAKHNLILMRRTP